MSERDTNENAVFPELLDPRGTYGVGRCAGSRNARTFAALGMQGLPSYLPSMLALEPGDASAARLFHLLLARFDRN